MLSVPAYYDGNSIQLLEPITAKPNQRLIVTVTDEFLEIAKDSIDVGEKNRSLDVFDYSRYGHRTERGQNVDEYMKEMRENDRF